MLILILSINNEFFLERYAHIKLNKYIPDDAITVYGKNTWFLTPILFRKKNSFILTNDNLLHYNHFISFDKFKKIYKKIDKPVYILGGSKFIETFYDIIDYIYLLPCQSNSIVLEKPISNFTKFFSKFKIFKQDIPWLYYTRLLDDPYKDYMDLLTQTAHFGQGQTKLLQFGNHLVFDISKTIPILRQSKIEATTEDNCFPVGTLILTKNGYREIQDICLKDFLLTHTGKWRQVKNIHTRIYKDTLISFTTAFGAEPFTCTKNHPFYVKELTKLSAKNPSWSTADHITYKHAFCMPINKNQKLPSSLGNINLWFLFGYFCTNGWVNEPGQINILVYHNKWIKSLIKLIFNIHNTCQFDILFKHNSHKWVHIFKSIENNIPEWIQDAPKLYVKAFINGFKHLNYPYPYAQRNVAYGIQRLYAKIGICCKVTLVGKSCCYKLDILDYPDLIDDNFMYFPIDSINNSSKIHSEICSSCGGGEYPLVYNFDVERDHSYTVQNIIVHNCNSNIYFNITENQLNCSITLDSIDIFNELPDLIKKYSIDTWVRAYQSNVKPGKIYTTIANGYINKSDLDLIRIYITSFKIPFPVLLMNPLIKNDTSFILYGL